LGDYLAAGDQILDGGACDVGVESTIIDCTGSAPKILRPGAITAQMIADSTGLEVVEQRSDGEAVDTQVIRVSGSLEAHYAPAATVVLDQSPVAGQGFIAMADVVAGDGVVRLAAPTTHEEFARVLYSALRAADEQGLETVVVQQPVGEGIAVAIRDRLKRAAFGSAKS
jgi:L-threonylcarbamoyladenylate synthase